MFALLGIICLPKKTKLTGLDKIAGNPSYSPWWTTVSLHATFQFTREEVLGPVDSKRWVTSPSQSNAEEQPRKASEALSVLAQKLGEKRGDWRVQAAHAARMQKAWFAWYNRSLDGASDVFFPKKSLEKHIKGCTLSTGCPNKFRMSQNYVNLECLKIREIEVTSAIFSRNVNKLSRIFSIFLTFKDLLQIPSQNFYQFFVLFFQIQVGNRWGFGTHCWSRLAYRSHGTKRKAGKGWNGAQSA